MNARRLISTRAHFNPAAEIFRVDTHEQPLTLTPARCDRNFVDSRIKPLHRRCEAISICPRLSRITWLNHALHSQVESIFLRTPIRVPFSSAAATLSLSPSCLFTASSVLCVPFLMRTSMRNLGGRACSRRTRTPRPMTVANEQCVIVGVISTTTVLIEERGDEGGRIRMSGRFTTAREPSESGCSGSEMDEMRSTAGEKQMSARLLRKAKSRIGVTPFPHVGLGAAGGGTHHRSPARQCLLQSRRPNRLLRRVARRGH